MFANNNVLDNAHNAQGILVPNAIQDLIFQVENVFPQPAALTVNSVYQELLRQELQLQDQKHVLLVHQTVMSALMQIHA